MDSITLTSSKVTDYVGNKIYEDGILKRILTDNGYIEGNTYYFYIKDHLGNNRIVANASGGVVQSTQYYPFGMAFAESTNQGTQPYKYNGKELDLDHGLNWYDYEARYLTNDVPRFTTMDPHSENYYSWSPYVYVGNNPMRFTDPDGRDWFVNNENGNLVYIKGANSLDKEIAGKYGLGNINNYENLGKDNMFGDKVKYGRFENMLDQEFVNFEGEGSSDNFMNKQGYEKAERVSIQDTKRTTIGDDGYSPKPHKITTIELSQTSKTWTTYVKPDKINTKKDLRIEKGDFFFSRYEKVSYELLKPPGQLNNATAYYREQRRTQTINKTIKVIDLALKLFRTFGK